MKSFKTPHSSFQLPTPPSKHLFSPFCSLAQEVNTSPEPAFSPLSTFHPSLPLLLQHCTSQSFFLPKAAQGLRRLVLEMQSPKQKSITQRTLVYQTLSLFGVYLIFTWYSIFISPAFSLLTIFDSVSSTVRDFLGREIIYNGAGTLKASVSLEILELMRVHTGFWILRTVIRNYIFNQNILTLALRGSSDSDFLSSGCRESFIKLQLMPGCGRMSF